jgi:hypothetical protein
MRKQTFLVIATLLLPGVATAQSDPTFNGLSAGLICHTRASQVCTTDTCVELPNVKMISHPDEQNNPGGYLHLRLKSRVIGLAGSAEPGGRHTPESSPLNIMEVSPAVLNKALYVKFNYSLGDVVSVGLLVYWPKTTGSYDIRFGITRPAEGDGGELHVVKVVNTGTCEIDNQFP